MTTESVSQYSELVYPDDVLGEMCDAARADGRTFSINENGLAGNEIPIELTYDLKYFKTMPDRYGVDQTYLDNNNRYDINLPSVLIQLPLRHVVHCRDDNEPNGVKRHGIKMESVAEVRELVDAAETAIPAGLQVYRPKGKIVTSEQNNKRSSSI